MSIFKTGGLDQYGAEPFKSSNSSSLKQLALKGLKHTRVINFCSQWSLLDGTLGTAFARPIQNDTPMMTKMSKSKPKVQFNAPAVCLRTRK